MTEVLLMPRAVGGPPATMPGFHAGRPPRNKGPALPGEPRRASRRSSP